MVLYCTVCLNNTRQNKNVSYFNYPKEHYRRQVWLRTVGREDLLSKLIVDKVRQQYRICEDHFEKSCIKFSKNRNVKYLFDHAFPTLKLPENDDACLSSTRCEIVFKLQNQNIQFTPTTEISSSSNNHILEDQTSRSLHTDPDKNTAVLSGAPFLEPKEEKAEPEPEACSSCTNTLAGFVYECVQCPQRVCGACGAAGAHGRHYVLRVPARSPRSEVELILDKVRSALELVVFKPSPRAKKKSDMADWASDESDTETDADDGDAETDADDAAEQTVEVKMEFYEEEHDPFGAPAALAVKREWSPPAPSTSHTHSHEDMLQVAIKREPEDIEFEVGAARAARPAARKRAHTAPPGKARPTNNDRTTTD